MTNDVPIFGARQSVRLSLTKKKCTKREATGSEFQNWAAFKSQRATLLRIIEEERKSLSRVHVVK